MVFYLFYYKNVRNIGENTSEHSSIDLNEYIKNRDKFMNENDKDDD